MSSGEAGPAEFVVVGNVSVTTDLDYDVDAIDDDVGAAVVVVVVVFFELLLHAARARLAPIRAPATRRNVRDMPAA